MKKELLIIGLKVVAYAIGLLLALFGVTSLTSCNASRNVESTGVSRIVVTDTTYVHHNFSYGFDKLK